VSGKYCPNRPLKWLLHLYLLDIAARQ